MRNFLKPDVFNTTACPPSRFDSHVNKLVISSPSKLKPGHHLVEETACTSSSIKGWDWTRYFERYNSKLREIGKKEERRRFKEFIAKAYELDPRVARRKLEKKLARCDIAVRAW